jgi:hypothetical protein
MVDRAGEPDYKPALPSRLAAGSAQVAQLVEHATENRSVGGSIPPLGTILEQIRERQIHSPSFAASSARSEERERQAAPAAYRVEYGEHEEISQAQPIAQTAGAKSDLICGAGRLNR